MAFGINSIFNQAKIISDLYNNFEENNYESDWLNKSHIIEVLSKTKDENILKLYKRIPLLYKKYNIEIEKLFSSKEFLSLSSNIIMIEIALKVLLNLEDKNLLDNSFFVFFMKTDDKFDKFESINTAIIEDRLDDSFLQDFLNKQVLVKSKSSDKTVSFYNTLHESVNLSDNLDVSNKTVPKMLSQNSDDSSRDFYRDSYDKKYSGELGDMLEWSTLYSLEKTPKIDLILQDVEKVILKIHKSDKSSLLENRRFNKSLKLFLDYLKVNFKQQLKQDYALSINWLLYDMKLLPCKSLELENKIIEVICDALNPFQLVQTLSILHKSEEINDDNSRIKFVNKYIKPMINIENPESNKNIVNLIFIIEKFFQDKTTDIQNKIIDEICDKCKNPIDVAKGLCMIKGATIFNTGKDRLVFTNKYLKYMYDLNNPKRFAKCIWILKNVIKDDIWMKNIYLVFKNSIIDDFDPSKDNIISGVKNNIADKVTYICQMYRNKDLYSNYFKYDDNKSEKIFDLLFIVSKSNDPSLTKNALEKIIDKSYDSGIQFLNDRVLGYLKKANSDEIKVFSKEIISYQEITASHITADLWHLGLMSDDDDDILYSNLLKAEPVKYNNLATKKLEDSSDYNDGSSDDDGSSGDNYGETDLEDTSKHKL